MNILLKLPKTNKVEGIDKSKVIFNPLEASIRNHDISVQK